MIEEFCEVQAHIPVFLISSWSPPPDCFLCPTILFPNAQTSAGQVPALHLS